MGRYVKIAGGFIVFSLFVSHLVGAGHDTATAVVMKDIERNAATTMRSIEKQVAEDSVTQYEIVQRNGSKIDQCVHAGLVAAAFVQAKDEDNYKIWKARENSDCKRAGVPR